MDQFPMDSINSARTLAAVSVANEVLKEHMRREEQAKIDRQNAPIVAGMNEMISELQNQNRLLASQLEEAKAAEQMANKQARNSKIFAWITFGVATLISLAALAVSIIALFL